MGLFVINLLKEVRKKEGRKKGILAGFKEKKINARNIKTSQFREEVLLFPLITEELCLLLAVRGRGALDHSDVPRLARGHVVYMTRKHTEKPLEWYLQAV